MTTDDSIQAAAPIAIATAHGRLYGTLSLPAQARALVLLAQCTPAPEICHGALRTALHAQAVGTVALDLLTGSEDRFADLPHDVSLLSRRLLDGLARLKQQKLLGELPPLPMGLYGSGDCSPVVLRVAALRDDDVSALVCHNGLIDLAGLLYLRTLAAPLLVLLDDDEPSRERSNRRALEQVSSVRELSVLSTRIGTSDPEQRSALPNSRDLAAQLATVATRWFLQHLSVSSRR